MVTLLHILGQDTMAAAVCGKGNEMSHVRE